MKALKERGGVMEAEDLANHKTRIVEPITTTYRGLRIHEIPPPTQVPLQSQCLLQMLQPLPHKWLPLQLTMLACKARQGRLLTAPGHFNSYNQKA